MRLNGWQRIGIVASVVWALALTAMVAGPTAHAADTTLTLACQGTKTFRMEGGANPLESTEPISMGIIVDLTARTVTGLDGQPPLTIESVKETTFRFALFRLVERPDGLADTWSVEGTIDRLTGDMTAKRAFRSTIWSYSLKCRPTQRMF
jgi:hypothetical protein